MPRPFILRKVCCRPDSNYFKPRGIPIDQLKEIILTMDELEAVRLADLQEMYQEDAAKKMNISRQTFANIVASARKKIADCLVNGKALKIEGGVVKMYPDSIRARQCRRQGYGFGQTRRVSRRGTL
ncbi:MAG: hypothetical protein COW11_03825 [Candidatus Omnitrophica bacterium CG12_big_fil_rev_8_21_14_0_65_43_15]|uniref:UPF0251 protein COW11_03825 n=1 Tax=Candidatus Taenaricola geysiri TaxID=1974752 RepID=A0A2J0LGM4_9BACT|nr:MAG: hypothetical protein AUJ89_04175 [Candidatus Omnitrophica bacterium CG1_02_43_210]PIR65266.1 MAG: hypothetical protein COU52_05055 [Candidatus Omnitrophica bacterium CG10_big_fil_rev_8_21_14_0_10_43_8]PIW66349.1 MAG: hypothetical protein COW11_03825 [Candidatus Omnitrophica bacterium CG12_big_fil_rev_8_21_14_0_65_43_15]PIW79847.1 MAG: hypothetical protein COZ98_05540 [Candidatus Omnitrophica bacterium CG_4_8_14_3_um_filter_43_15]PIY83903.1 MAG: hypothetical protein COY77_04585 [Candidat